MTDIARISKATRKAEAVVANAQMAKAAYELRRSGASVYEIAEALSIPEQEVYRTLADRLADAARLVDEGTTREIVALEAERLDNLQRAVWGNAMAGDVRSVEAVLRIMDRRAKLYGLDKQVETQNVASTVIVQGASSEYIAAIQAMRGAAS